MLNSALSYAARGWHIHPLIPNDKRPLLGGWPKQASISTEAIDLWWNNNPSANIGIACGQASNLVVLDFDCKNGAKGMDTLVTLEAKFNGLKTLRAQTPSGGVHLYFTYPAQPLGNKVGVMAGLDIRSDNGYVAAPPSVIPQGAYTWVNDEQPAELPQELLEMLRSVPVESPLKSESNAIPEGRRNETLFRHACALGDGLRYGKSKPFKP
ncbi:MAG: hypothetical protein EBQ92_01505 [Proteobacteria bacterium]|nr:hypothetical protein [Pseudomonadota bacterium]